MKTQYGIEYTEPAVHILHDTGIAHAEIAGRTAYNSFANSENQLIKLMTNESQVKSLVNTLSNVDIQSSDLLNQLAWVHHHHSVIEHSSITYLIKDIGRGVLQELVRHRIASYTVQSSRYTMGSIINAYIASLEDDEPYLWFINKMIKLDILIIPNEDYQKNEFDGIWKKLIYQTLMIGRDEFNKIAIAKSSLIYLNDSFTADELFERLEAGKAKRNIGDPFKHIVTDNWKTELVMTINLRSLKNFFDLRDSGAAWFQIQWLAEEMKKQTPIKYLKLIDKKHKG